MPDLSSTTLPVPNVAMVALCEIDELGYPECVRRGVVEAIMGDTFGGEQIGVWVCAPCFLGKLGGTLVELPSVDPGEENEPSHA
jgi:hypothetical protein